MGATNKFQLLSTAGRGRRIDWPRPGCPPPALHRLELALDLACHRAESYLNGVRLGLLILGCLAVTGLAACDGCSRDGAGGTPRAQASADPEGRDLIKGAVVAATEKSGGVRLYKIVKINWFPEPMGEELVMIAYEEKAATFEACAKLWAQGQLTIALPRVRVAKHLFMRRDHRIITDEPVTDEELKGQRGDPQRPKAH